MKTREHPVFIKQTDLLNSHSVATLVDRGLNTRGGG